MATVRLSTKGQLVLPKEIRDHYGWVAGTELELVDQDGVVVLRPLTRDRGTAVDEVFGMLHTGAAPLSLEDMDTAIAAEALRRARRS